MENLFARLSRPILLQGAEYKVKMKGSNSEGLKTRFEAYPMSKDVGEYIRMAESLESRIVANSVDIENMCIELFEMTGRIKAEQKAALEAAVPEPI